MHPAPQASDVQQTANLELDSGDISLLGGTTEARAPAPADEP